MTPEEYQGAQTLCAQAAAMLAMIDVPDLLRRIDKAEAVGPMLDPTLYRAKSRAMGEDKEMLEAALPLWRWAQKVKAEVESKARK